METEQPARADILSDQSLSVCLAALDKLQAHLETILAYALNANKGQMDSLVAQAASADREAIRQARREIHAEWRRRHPEDGDY
jgi:phosphatidylserine/phosphatidylglycerophosphate/cardiolipin synthase-like enzyme